MSVDSNGSEPRSPRSRTAGSETPGSDEAKDEYVVADLPPTNNSTTVSGKWVRPATLPPGHEIRNRNTSFRFEMGSPSEV